MTSPSVVRRETLLSNPWIDVGARIMRGMPGCADDMVYYVVRPHDYVSVLALTADGQFVLVRQYRPVVDRMTLELPSGLLDPGETPVETARRELLEETGYVAGEVEPLGALVPDTGRLENTLWCFLARDVVLDPTWSLPDDGVEPLLVSPSELLNLVRTGGFDHALHLAVVMLALAHGQLGALVLRDDRGR